MPAGARTERPPPEEAEARSRDPPASPTVSLAPPSGAPYLRPRERQSPEAGGDLPRPRRGRAGPRVRSLPGAEVRRRPAGLQGRRAGQPALHYLRGRGSHLAHHPRVRRGSAGRPQAGRLLRRDGDLRPFRDRKSTRLNSSHSQISYAVFCLKKKKTRTTLLAHTLSSPPRP